MAILISACVLELKSPPSERVSISLLLTDFSVTVTSLVVGILGLTSVIGMPSAASWACIGVGGTISLIYLVLRIGVFNDHKSQVQQVYTSGLFETDWDN